MGCSRGPPWRVQYCGTIQHCPKNSTPDSDDTQPPYLGTVSLLRKGKNSSSQLDMILIILIQTQKYPIMKCCVAVTSLLLLLGGIEAGLIFALQAAKSHGLEWPLIVTAVLSACLLAAGVLRHYWDIYVHHTVRGISFIFVGIDAAGDLFSILSVCRSIPSSGRGGQWLISKQCLGRLLMFLA